MYALGASLAPYPGMVCPLFGFTPAATVFGLMTDDAFIERFVSSELLGADAERFEKYVDELYAIAGHADADGKAGFQGTVYVYIAPSETRRANSRGERRKADLLANAPFGSVREWGSRRT